MHLTINNKEKILEMIHELNSNQAQYSLKLSYSTQNALNFCVLDMSIGLNQLKNQTQPFFEFLNIK
jgi:hypothetical protein